jgi:hypothetical protein
MLFSEWIVGYWECDLAHYVYIQKEFSVAYWTIDAFTSKSHEQA